MAAALALRDFAIAHALCPLVPAVPPDADEVFHSGTSKDLSFLRLSLVVRFITAPHHRVTSKHRAQSASDISSNKQLGNEK